MTLQISNHEPCQTQFYPMMLKVMTDEETRQYHRKKLFELSKLERAKLEFRVDGSIWREGKPITEEPNDEQKQWLKRKMKAPARAWETCIEHRPWIFRWAYFVLGDWD